MPASKRCVNCTQQALYPQMLHPIALTQKDIMVIGETLTAVESRKGTLMSGPGADILKQTMQKVGLPIDNKTVHYTVAVACAVPKRKGKPFPKEPILACRNRLLDEIEAVNPKMILVLGKTALQVLTGNLNVKITEEYARPQKLPYCGEAIVLPIMNPGMIIRAPSEYKPFLASLELAARLYSGSGSHDTGETKWQVLDTEELVDKALKFLKTKTHVTADIETTGLDYRIVHFLVAGICFEKNKVLVVPRSMRHRLQEFFKLDMTWTWHHGKYDSKVCWRRGLGNIPHDGDTIYQHYMLDETSAHDLGFLTKTFLQAEEYKWKMNQNWKSVTLESYPEFYDALIERVAVDADYTFQLEQKLMETLNYPENARMKYLYDNLMMPGARFLERVERNGMLVDKEFLEVMDKEYDVVIAQILREVEEAAAPYWDREMYMEQADAKTAPVKFNPGSSKQMAWMVHDRLKLKPKIRKKRSTDAAVLNSIETDLPLIKKVLEYRSVQKEQSTYVKGTLNWRDIDGRVRSNFSLHITATGRLSSKEPNVQNVPSAHGVGNIRRAYIPREGYVLMEVDYSGAELRWLAFLSKCPILGAVFREGRNLHNETATALFGPHYGKAQKMRAKAVNFGIPYGRQAKSFKDEFGISLEEAQAMIDGWLDNYYGARDYLMWCAHQVVAGNYLETPWGRQRRFGLVTAESLGGLENEAMNYPIQSSSSDLLLFAGMTVEEELYTEYDTTVIDLVHDSLVLEVPYDLATVQAVAKYVSETMVELPTKLFNCDIPFQTDCEIGPSWGELVTFNYKTGFVEIENKATDEVEDVIYADWLQKSYHWEIYQSPWYKELQPLDTNFAFGRYK